MEHYALKNSKGFTLVELMVVVGIMSILAAVIVPAYHNNMPRWRLKSAARDVYSTMQDARMMAIREGRNIRLVFTGNPGFYFYDLDNSGNWNAGEQRTDLTTYGYGIDYGQGSAMTNWNGNAINLTPTTITFTPQGTANADTVYLDNQNNSICYAVTSRITGSIRLRQFSINTWDQ